MNEDMRTPIRIFIGSSAKNFIEERVLIFSLHKCTKWPLEIKIFDGVRGTVKNENGSHEEMLRAAEHFHLNRATAFSLCRFTIPYLCNYQSRAIYLDSDQIVLQDILELWNYKLDTGSAIAAVPDKTKTTEDGYLSSVMLMDCQKLAGWNPQEIIESLEEEKFFYKDMMWMKSGFRKKFDFSVQELPDIWNHLDVVKQDSKIIHFTDLSRQPWRFHHHCFGFFWEKFYLEAVRKGFLSSKELTSACEQGFILKRIAFIPKMHPIVRPLMNGIWRIWGRLTHSFRQSWKYLRRTIRTALKKCLEWLEKSFLGERYNFSIRERVVYKNRLTVLWKFFCFLFWGKRLQGGEEIIVLISATPCERMLLPIVYRLLRRKDRQTRNYRINLVLLTKLKPLILEELLSLGCHIEFDQYSFIRAAIQPKGKVVLMCLDQNLTAHFRFGFETANHLRRFSVRTISIQHGGTRDDSLKQLSTAASDIVLIWNKETFNRLVTQYGVSPSRLRIVGNPLHDSLNSVDRDKVLTRLVNYFSLNRQIIETKKLVLVTTCLHSEYGDNGEKYVRYMKHLYNSMDFTKIYLIVKMHPNDCVNPNIYRTSIPSEVHEPEHLAIIEPNIPGLDFYSLLSISTVVITRASTAGEEALALGKAVIAFDIDSSGPSKGYKHLENHPNYQTVYARPEDALRNAISFAIAHYPDFSSPDTMLIKKLNTNGTNNVESAANVILKELHTNSNLE